MIQGASDIKYTYNYYLTVMKYQRLHSQVISSSRFWTWMIVMLFSFMVSPALADELDYDKNFTVTQYKDHVHFSIMIMDGKNKDTWCRVGSIHAWSGSNQTGTHLHLMDVECDQGEDDSTNKEIFSRNVLEGTKAILTNSIYGNTVIQFATWDEWGDGNDNNVRKKRPNKVRYTIRKSSSELRPCVEIDYYWNADMAGKTWYFNYEFIHNGGSTKNRNMGSAYCSSDLGLSSVDFGSGIFHDRLSYDKITFTLPGFKDDIPAEMQDHVSHYITYDLQLKYTLQDGSYFYKTDRLEGKAGMRNPYDVAIPEEVGNFKRIDMTLQATAGLKWSNDKNKKLQDYSRKLNDFMPEVPEPYGLTAEYNQYDKQAVLSWNAFATGDYFIRRSVPYIYRRPTDKNGSPESGATWTQRGSNDAIYDSQTQGYTDTSLEANKYYQYMVLNVPVEWLDNNSIKSSELTNPEERLINRLGHCVSEPIATLPNVSIYNLAQDTTVTDKVRLTWEYSRVPVNADNVNFEVKRRLKGSSEWANYGNATLPSAPTAGSVASFTDTDLPSVSETFEYKIVLNINDGKNTFESDVITAGLLSGSVVLSVDATKGTHEDVVRVLWKVKQVGTANSNFEVSRRYAGSTDEFMKIYSVSGNTDNYTYEDNTVQPGYYYEYKVECYSGDKDTYTDNNYQNVLSDVGFCQARGVISGRISFGTGTAVENVRVSLRSSEDPESNGARGYSQHVNGASTGITWAADSVETSKLFGDNQDYSLQMYVRPDEGMANGAVLSEIPGVGRLLLGSKTAEGHKVILEKYGMKTTEKGSYSSIIQFRGVLYYKDINEPTRETMFGTVYNTTTAYGMFNELLNDGYTMIDDVTLGPDSENPAYVNIKIFQKETTLDVNMVISNTSWKGTLYDTRQVLPATIYSSFTLQKIGDELKLIINDSTTVSSQFVQTGEKDYHFSDNNSYLYPEATVYADCLHSAIVNGTLDSWLDKWVRRNLSPNGTKTTDIRKFMKNFSVGGADDSTEETAFKGHVTEVRVWNHVLTESEMTSYADRVMNGREPGLKLYWPMDEGIDRFVFDASYSNDVPNGRHATVGNNILSSRLIPSEEQLSRYGMTNANGEYIIRGIPFVGSGSTYTVTPTKNIHTFNPMTRNGFIGNGSLALNNFDFTDQSSFPVRGTVTYLNTNIPADSIQFKIDGSLVQDKNGASMSDSNGEFEISVPIGEHLIEAYKNGHRLTSFPLNGSTYDFHQGETINFIDSTLVNVTGRINGGFSDQNEPVGFGRSENRLGKATIKLSLGKESMCSFNYILNEHGEGSFGTTDLPVESATPEIKSTSRRGGGSHDDTYYIYITTDEKTGEYSALLPPLKYKVESITFDGGSDYDNLPVFAQNLPIIDATNTIKESMMKDTLTVDGIKTEYYYSAKMNRQYRATPTILVSQKGMKNGAFGEEKVPVLNLDNSIDSVAVIRYTDTGYQYIYDYPLFRQEQNYEFDIDVFEHYVNLDSGKEYKEIPLDANINIYNEGCMSTTVYAETVTIDGQEVEAGTAYEVQHIKAKADKKGHISYLWKGGWPNLGDGHLRNITISTEIGGRTTMWKAPGSSSDALDAILLGSMITGKNFVTSGPDHVDMILRRPPGSTSVASLQSETLTTNTTGECTNENSTFGGGAYISATPTFEISQGTVLGIAILAKSKFKIIINENLQDFDTYGSSVTVSDADTYSVTEQMKTPSNAKFVQYQGDTYIGRASNLLFGKGRELNLFKNSDGTYSIDTKESICVGQSFTTTFVYPQAHIEETLIPNWEAILDEKLVYMEGDLYAKKEELKVPGKVMYYTNYKRGDREYAHTNGDTDFWTPEQIKAAHGFPSYIIVNGTEQEGVNDEVNWYIEQIRLWKERIKDNEKDKLDAFSDEKYFVDNYSIAGGTSVSQTNKHTHTKNTSHKHTYNYNLNSETHLGAMLNDAGSYAIIKYTSNEGWTKDTTTVNSNTQTVSWTLSDAEPTTSLSVDVYKSPSGWGPIFRTRGGQTSNPYEGATYTKYYNEGTKLDEATMHVEYPALRVNGANRITDVPMGGEAKFDLVLSNLSETNTPSKYVLEAIDGSNPQGAILTIDGTPLSMGYTGRTVRLAGNESVHKTLFVKQSDRSITKYEDIRLVLRSEKDVRTHSDTIRLSVEFVPASAIAELKVSRTVLNLPDFNNKGGFETTIYNLDRQDEGLKGIRLQYRRKGTDSWGVIKQWSLDPKKVGNGYEPMPEGSSFTVPVSFPSDGEYEMRAQTFGTYGDEEEEEVEEVTYETDIITVVQDLRGPKILGMPSPENGILTYMNRNNMHVRYNEVLNGNTLSHTDNFVIEGELNNSSVDEAYADVAYQLNSSPCYTEATYTLENKDVAVGMWFYRQGDGIIMTIGKDRLFFSLSTINGGKVLLGLGEGNESVQSDVVLPENKWNYIAISYKHSTEEDSNNYLTVMYVNSETDPVYIVKDMVVNEMFGNGQIGIGGFNMKGMMHDLTLWNTYKSVTELYETRDETKANYTPGLIGYWRMDEGHGTTLADKVRSRDITLPTESWYINNRNLAAHLDGTNPFKVDISTFVPRATDNFAVELWFRAEQTASNANAKLLSALNSLEVGFKDSKLVLSKSTRTVDANNVEQVTVAEEITLSDANYIDNQWHHFALNVRRGTSAVAYIDGQPVKTMPETSIPAVNSHYLVIGGELTLLDEQGTNAGGTTNLFTGDIDEVRIWNAAITSKLLDKRRYERLDSTYSGLIGYFPMESIHRTTAGTVEATFTTKNFGNNKVHKLTAEGQVTESVNAPALKPGSQHMRLNQNEFDFTAANDDIYFSFKPFMLPKMDGNDFSVTIENIKDEHGNPSEPVEWMFHADFASLNWDVEAIDLEKEWDSSLTFDMKVNNYADVGDTQIYEIIGLPSWITVDETIGIMNKNVETISFTILPSVPVGRYEEYIYISDNHGIKRMFQLNLKVKGNEPDWSVNPSLYESNMSLCGQIYIDDKIHTNPDSKIAAFDSYGNCCGVAGPKYMPSRDSYYINMVIYGGSSSELSTSERDLTFKMYDASTGKTYSVVEFSLPNKGKSSVLTYAPDALYGTYDEPVAFYATDQLQQVVQLEKGWTWMSIFVQPQSTDIADVLPKNANDLKKLQNIKGHKAFATVNKSGSGIMGELTEIVPGNMYKIQTSGKINLELIGSVINVREQSQTIYPGHNWIGTLSNVVMSPEQAFADLAPVNGDMVKTRGAFSSYRDGIWEGELRNIVPGEGYIYTSKDTKEKTFHYPTVSGGLAASNAASFTWRAPLRRTMSYEPVDEHLYPDNMNMIAVVKKDGSLVEDAEVAAFVNGECRGAVDYNNGYYFLTVLGSSSEDLNETVEIIVRIGGEEYAVASQPFVSDAFYGSLDEPYVLDVDATAIRTVTFDDIDDDEDWFTLQGVKLNHRPSQQGVYLHRGEKVVIKRR